MILQKIGSHWLSVVSGDDMESLWLSDEEKAMTKTQPDSQSSKKKSQKIQLSE